MSEDSHELSSQRRESDKEDHVCFKASKEDDDIEITYLSYDQVFNKYVKLSRDNYKLEKNIVDF